MWHYQAGRLSKPFRTRLLYSPMLASAAGVVWAVALTPDGRQALTASEDFTARVWDIMSGTCERVLEGHTGWVVGMAISPDGSHAVTASHDGTAR